MSAEQSVAVGGSLAVEDLHASYGEIEALHGMSFSVPPGGVLALLGPNGAGKTTTMRSICGHVTGRLHSTRGTIHYDGAEITSKRSSALSRSGICLVPEGRGVFPNLTVSENLWMWTHKGSCRRSAVEETAFARFPILEKRRNQLAGTMSGGEQQMLALSRALVTNPRLLLLDELSMGLAPQLVTELYEVVKGIAADGTSVLLVEQSIATALSIADEVAFISHGRVERSGKPAEMADDALELYLSL